MKMKKALILAYDFLPYVSVGGLRPYSWYKYSKESGVEPVVVTRQWDNKHGNSLDYIEVSDSKKTIVEETDCGKIIRAPYFPNLANKILLKYGEKKFRILRKAISAFYEIFQWLFFVGPKVQLYFAAKKYLQTNSVDVIIATGEPFVLFRYASLLSQKFDVPWIADYRDPWSQNKSRSKNVFFKKWFFYLEKKHLKNVSLIITVSNFVKKHIITLIKNKEVATISNGYDASFVKDIINIKQNSEIFSIGFAGTIYPWHPIKSFLSVINKLILSKKINTIRVNFYGINKDAEIRQMINNEYNSLVSKVVFHSKLPNKELISKLANNNLFLLFNDYSILGTKIYDYLAVKRKILLCYSADDEAIKLKEKYYNVEELALVNNHLQEDLIKETNSGIIVKDSACLLNVLQELYLEFQEKGFVACNSKNAEQYSRKHQVEKLAEIIKAL
ncbi:MAG: glycosyltransferase [Bacteroidetes bacterium]|nr:glycosyltransferase [Bacteroidota bacterium]